MSSARIRLMVGLGNIGAEYDHTRHNVGFWFLDQLANQSHVQFREETKFHGSVARSRLQGEDVWLLKPSTYMNRSGDAVIALAQYYKISPQEILVIHDDLDLPPGCMKFKCGGGTAGHNGLKDITAKLATPNCWRLRFGIGHPRNLGMQQGVADFVLSSPSREHLQLIEQCQQQALNSIADLATGETDRFIRSISKYGHLPKKSPDSTPE